MRYFLFLILGATALTCCKAPSDFPLQRDWQLLELKNKTLPADVAVTLRFEGSGKRFSGNNSCNNYNGTYEKSEPSVLRFGPAMATKKYCAAVADWESAYMTVLTTVDNYAIREGRLHLYAGTKLVAVFK
ncbi:MAG: META domain-containing protein [Saprospiraceae bacterium]|nr:META domain-containing protein [Saprospiraceae bacterium]